MPSAVHVFVSVQRGTPLFTEYPADTCLRPCLLAPSLKSVFELGEQHPDHLTFQK